MNYEQLLSEGDPMAAWEAPPDEWDTLSLRLGLFREFRELKLVFCAKCQVS